MLLESNAFFIRDIHCFDERVVSPTHEIPLKETSLAYETLPIVDWAFWSRSIGDHAGMWPLLLDTENEVSPMRPEGKPVVKELNLTDLSIQQPLVGGGSFSVVCSEKEIAFTGVVAEGKPLKWAWDIHGGEQLKSMVRKVNKGGIVYHHLGEEYRLKVGVGSCYQLQDDSIRLLPNKAGKLVVGFDTSDEVAVSSKMLAVPGRDLGLETQN